MAYIVTCEDGSQHSCDSKREADAVVRSRGGSYKKTRKGGRDSTSGGMHESNGDAIDRATRATALTMQLVAKAELGDKQAAAMLHADGYHYEMKATAYPRDGNTKKLGDEDLDGLDEFDEL